MNNRQRTTITQNNNNNNKKQTEKEENTTNTHTHKHMRATSECNTWFDRTNAAFFACRVDQKKNNNKCKKTRITQHNTHTLAFTSIVRQWCDFLLIKFARLIHLRKDLLLRLLVLLIFLNVVVVVFLTFRRRKKQQQMF